METQNQPTREANHQVKQIDSRIYDLFGAWDVTLNVPRALP